MSNPEFAPKRPMSGWLTAAEAARYIGLPSTKALYQAVRRGQVIAHRLGTRRLRFSAAELDALIRGASSRCRSSDRTD